MIRRNEVRKEPTFVFVGTTTQSTLLTFLFLAFSHVGGNTTRTSRIKKPWKKRNSILKLENPRGASSCHKKWNKKMIPQHTSKIHFGKRQQKKRWNQCNGLIIAPNSTIFEIDSSDYSLASLQGGVIWGTCWLEKNVLNWNALRLFHYYFERRFCFFVTNLCRRSRLKYCATTCTRSKVLFDVLWQGTTIWPTLGVLQVKIYLHLPFMCGGLASTVA